MDGERGAGFDANDERQPVMSENPYQPPEFSSGYAGVRQSSQLAAGAVVAPAIRLMIEAGISIACLCVTIPFDIFLLASGVAGEMDRRGEINPALKIIVRTIWGLVILLASGFVFWGALQMKNLRNYQTAQAAAIVAVIPCVGPCCVLGISFGAWAIAVLSRPEVKAAFAS
jgi:uncharacterized membrane protein YhaH (DUF805 family)